LARGRPASPATTILLHLLPPEKLIRIELPISDPHRAPPVKPLI